MIYLWKINRILLEKIINFDETNLVNKMKYVLFESFRLYIFENYNVEKLISINYFVTLWLHALKIIFTEFIIFIKYPKIYLNISHIFNVYIYVCVKFKLRNIMIYRKKINRYI